MSRLQSGIGVEQRKHTSLRTKSEHYRRMAAAIVAKDGPMISRFPKYIPRGHPPEWYLTGQRNMTRSLPLLGRWPVSWLTWSIGTTLRRNHQRPYGKVSSGRIGGRVIMDY